MPINSFTIRVYGLLIHHDEILLSRENIQGKLYTKFPGGGLEFGEGILECLQREFMEEVQVELSKMELYYITEDFVPSAFHDDKQVISIYYKVESEQADAIKTGNPRNNLLLNQDRDQVVYWCPLAQLKKEPIELPIDKRVVSKMCE